LLEEIWKDLTNFQQFNNQNFYIFDKVFHNFGKPDVDMIFSTRYIWGFMPNSRKILERFLFNLQAFQFPFWPWFTFEVGLLKFQTAVVIQGTIHVLRNQDLSFSDPPQLCVEIGFYADIS